MVKEYLREADGIWIVASINRAVNDKTAKNMLGPAAREMAGGRWREGGS